LKEGIVEKIYKKNLQKKPTKKKTSIRFERKTTKDEI
jgi:hypothetical protein